MGSACTNPSFWSARPRVVGRKRLWEAVRRRSASRVVTGRDRMAREAGRAPSRGDQAVPDPVDFIVAKTDLVEVAHGPAVAAVEMLEHVVDLLRGHLTSSRTASRASGGCAAR